MGSHGFLCLFADAIQATRRSYAPSYFPCDATFPYEAEVFVDDDMMVGASIGSRVKECVDRDRWGSPCEMLLGDRSTNLDKLGIWGTWQRKQTMLGADIDTRNFARSLPKAQLKAPFYLPIRIL